LDPIHQVFLMLIILDLIACVMLLPLARAELRGGGSRRSEDATEEEEDVKPGGPRGEVRR
jgi:hypothetical protein